MTERIDDIVSRLYRRGCSPAGIAFTLRLIAESQEVASAAWTDALEAAAKEIERTEV